MSGTDLAARKVGAEGHHGHRREGGDHRDDGRQDEVRLVHVAGHRLLLDEELEAVGRQLEEAEPLQERRPAPECTRPTARSSGSGPGRPWIQAHTLRSAIVHRLDIGKTTRMTARPLRRPWTTSGRLKKKSAMGGDRRGGRVMQASCPRRTAATPRVSHRGGGRCRECCRSAPCRAPGPRRRSAPRGRRGRSGPRRDKGACRPACRRPRRSISPAPRGRRGRRPGRERPRRTSGAGTAG